MAQLRHRDRYTWLMTCKPLFLTDVANFRRSRHQKGKTVLDFNEARDDGVAVSSTGPYENHLHLTQDR